MHYALYIKCIMQYAICILYTMQQYAFIYIQDLLNDKDSYMQFNKSHISLITTFEHKKREEKGSVHCSFQASQVFSSSVLAVVSDGKSKSIFGLLSILFLLSRSSFRLGQGWDSTFGTWMCGTGTLGRAWGSSYWVCSWDWGGSRVVSVRHQLPQVLFYLYLFPESDRYYLV